MADNDRTMHRLHVPMVVFSLLSFAAPVFADDADSVRELQRVVDAQQRQLEAQSRQLEMQMRLIRQLQSEVERLAENADGAPLTPGDTRAHEPLASASAQDEIQPRPASVAEEGHLAERSSETGEYRDYADQNTISSLTDTAPSPPESRSTKAGVAQADRFDTRSPSSVDVTYIDPTATINIPGTQTSIGLHGFAQFQIIHDTNGPAGNQFDTAFIPVDGAPSETKFNVNPSRIALSSVTPVPDGQLNTMISMDFNGQVDRPDPRLRLAYGEFVSEETGVGLLGGQTFATMADLRATPETVDFAVPAGSWAQRQPLLRLSKSFRSRFLLETSLETPQNVRYVDAEKRTRLPDAVLAGTWFVNSSYLRHVRLNVLARDLRAEGTNGVMDSAVGWAIAASTKLDLPFFGKRDNLRLNIHHGEGYGTQLKGGPQEAVFNTATSVLDLIEISSLFGGIQHFWSNKLRSNLTYGYVDADNPVSMPDDALASTTYASVNLIWNPYEQLTLGTEYLWGQRKNVDGASGTSDRILFSSRLDF